MAMRAFILVAVVTCLAGCSGSADRISSGEDSDGGENSGGGQVIAAGIDVDALDRAYQDLVANEETLGKLLAAIHSRADAERTIAPLKEMYRERDAIYVQLAELPPLGMPPELREQYQAAKKFQDSVQERLAANKEADAINEVLMASLRDEVVNAERMKDFRLSSELRRHGKGNIVRVELKNRENLSSSQHQAAIHRLKESAGALHAESLINDNEYFLVLAPVSDLQAFINKIEVGAVSNVDAQARQFTVSLDPAKIPGDAAGEAPSFAGGPGGGPPGHSFAPERFPPGATPGQGSGASPPSAGEPLEQELFQIDSMRSGFANAHGRDNILELHLKNVRPFHGPRMSKALGLMRDAVRGPTLQMIPLRSGGMYLFLKSSADVNTLASALDLGGTELVDGPGRRLVIVLEDAKVPQ